MSDNTDKWYLSGPLGIDVPEPPQQLSLTGGIGFANHNAKDKKLYSPADGVLEWMTHDWAGQHGFAVSHQGTQRVFLNTNGNSYLNGGNVGIGTTEPNRAKLEVSGMEGVGHTVALFGRGAQGVSVVANGPTVGFNTYYDGVVWKSISAGRTGVISNDQSNGNMDFIIGSKAANPDEAVTMATTPLSLTSEGKVGIGTRGPQAQLHVNGDTVISGNTTVGGNVTTSQLNVQGDIHWSNDHSTSGYVRLGNLQICWGRGQIDTGNRLENSQDINFPNPYPQSLIPVVTITINDPGPTESEFRGGAGVSEVNSTMFKVLHKRLHKLPEVKITFYWIAIGSIA